MIERKMVTVSRLKLSDSGKFSALFCTWNRIDKQGDLTLKGAFGRQNVVISAYGHGSSIGSALPVGKGTIYDGAEGGVCEGQFFLDTAGGKETYVVVKQLGDLAEWSYSLPSAESELRTVGSLLDQGLPLALNGHSRSDVVRVLKRITVKEVSPVMLGAGDTRTLAIKSAGRTDVLGEWLRFREIVARYEALFR